MPRSAYGAEVSTAVFRRTIGQAVDRIVHIRKTEAGRQAEVVLGVDPDERAGWVVRRLG